MTRCIIIIALSVVYLTASPMPVYEGSPLYRHLLFHAFHSNIFHLAGNLICVYLLRNARWVEAYVVATLCSFAITEPTVGLSGVIFAAIGICYGHLAEYGKMARCLAYTFVIGLLPGVSMVYHIISLLTGYAYGWSIGSIRIYNNRPS